MKYKWWWLVQVVGTSLPLRSEGESSKYFKYPGSCHLSIFRQVTNTLTLHIFKAATEAEGTHSVTASHLFDTFWKTFNESVYHIFFFFFHILVSNFNIMKTWSPTLLLVLVHAGLFWCFQFHNPPNTHMDYRIFNMCMWSFCKCTDTVDLSLYL